MDKGARGEGTAWEQVELWCSASGRQQNHRSVKAGAGSQDPDRLRYRSV
jgi:hypothetical protein